ncbi:membrane-bound ClpP family serine protease [Leucobacter exalbidus]|uniref:Membrane-bound ClpP family serine protease n=1 Tax=Leucobacter exalbidus TaxID=662960 RepID=A0A940PL20_9MICO|nr:DUF5684 domain-containing protein [Leucobacter exalbidus]MBP1325105.1 membrane-bound ClpP family serine protease [Leucobacter exalbidus]
MLAIDSITDQAELNTLFALNGTSGIFALIVYVIVAIGLWKVFTKAGYPGILAIIPIVNMFVLVKVAGYSAWMTLLYIIPLVNIVFAIFVAIRTGERFGKGGLFSIVLLWLFPMIGYLILGFGSATYRPRTR